MKSLAPFCKSFMNATFCASLYSLWGKFMSSSMKRLKAGDVRRSRLLITA